MSAFTTTPPNLDEGEHVLTTLTAVTLACSSEEGECEVLSRGDGTLFVTSKRIVWAPSSSGAEPFECEATSLNMHAVSREGVESFARPCIYCQLDQSKGLPEEVYFAPSDQALLEDCFRSFSQTAMLNPPPDEEDDGGGLFGGEGEGFEGFYGEVDDELMVPEEHGTPNESSLNPTDEDRASALAHLDSILQVPPQFEVQTGQFNDEVEDNANGP